MKGKAVALAYIGLGSNLGWGGRSPAGTLPAAVVELAELGVVRARSSLYQTEPVGFADQPAFVNAVVAVETSMTAEGLLERLLAIERSFGRDREAGVRNGPRTLDLDLLMLDQEIVQSADLVLPHPRLAERRFVLAPLAEIAPDLRHPVLGATMQELLQRLPDQGENGVGAVLRVDL